MTERTPEEIAAGRCETCRFWLVNYWRRNTDRNLMPSGGSCQRFPEFVPRKATDWCGEYQPLIEKDSRRGG